MSLNGNLNKSQFMEELQQKVEHINDVLEKFLPAEEGQQRIIFEAMNYSVRAGGKRPYPHGRDLPYVWRKQCSD
jgi:geranylgeranyl diphosphate synthase type II